jgi:hypothetical protein
MPARRFPPPWTVEDIGAAFVVTDSAGQQLAYIYFEDEPGRRSAAKLLSKEIGVRSLNSVQQPVVGWGNIRSVSPVKPASRAACGRSAEQTIQEKILGKILGLKILCLTTASAATEPLS